VEVCDRIVALNKGEIKRYSDLYRNATRVRDVFRGLNFHISKEMYFTSHYTKRFFLKFNDKTVAFENQYI
jgi:hypothetical protein